jgi:hypothetical protein
MNEPNWSEQQVEELIRKFLESLISEARTS